MFLLDQEGSTMHLCTARIIFQSNNKIEFNGKTRIKCHIWKCILCLSQSNTFLLGAIQKPFSTGLHLCLVMKFLVFSMNKNNNFITEITFCRHSKVSRFYHNSTAFLINFSEILALERCNCTNGMFVVFNSIIYYRQFQTISLFLFYYNSLCLCLFYLEFVHGYICRY